MNTIKRVMELKVRVEWWDSNPPTPNSGNWSAEVDTQEQIEAIFEDYVERVNLPAPPEEGALTITVTECKEVTEN